MNETVPKISRDNYEGFEAVPVRVVVRVGSARSTVARLAALEAGDVLVLDRALGEPFDLVVAERAIGRVEPVSSDAGVSVKLVDVVAEEGDDPR